MASKDDRDALTDPDGKSKAYQSKVPSVSRAMDKIMTKAVKYTSNAVKSILGDLKASGTFSTKQQAYDWLKKTPNMDAVWALVKQAQSIPNQAKRDQMMRKIMAGAKVHRMSRLEAIEQSLEINRTAIIEGVKRNVTPIIKTVTKDAYYRQTFTLQKQVGVGWTFDEPPAGQIVKGMTSDLEKMADWYHGPLDKDLRDTIVEGIATGKSSDQIGRDLRQQGVPPARAKAVARTMLTTVSNEAEMEALKKTRIKRYEYVATLDERTCPVCGGLDGRTFPLDDARAGINFPPMHPNCRCVHIAALSKDIKAELTRSARDEHGKTREVPADMTYAEWLRKYGSKRAQDRFAKPAKVPQKKAEPAPKYSRDVPTRERVTVTVDDFDGMTRTPKMRKNTENIVEYLNAKEDADPNAVAVIQKVMGKRNTPELKVRYEFNCKVRPSLREPVLSIPNQEAGAMKGRMGVTFHEMTHLSDFFHRKDLDSINLASGWEHPELTQAIADTSADIPESIQKVFDDFHKYDDDLFKRCNDLANERHKSVEDLRAKLNTMKRTDPEYWEVANEYNAEVKAYNQYVKDVNQMYDDGGRDEGVDLLEDIFDALSKGHHQADGTVYYGHGVKYYADKGMQEEEIIANWVSMSIMRPDLAELLRKEKPELCKVLDQMMYDMGE